jgi:hypothetical protein
MRLFSETRKPRGYPSAGAQKNRNLIWMKTEGPKTTPEKVTPLSAKYDCPLWRLLWNQTKIFGKS